MRGVLQLALFGSMHWTLSITLHYTFILQRISGSAAELKASGAEKATAICCSFLIRYINKQSFFYKG